MPLFSYDNVDIYYEESGDGFPILLFAPGGMKSALSFWAGSQWNPIEVLSDEYRVIAMDQRNAGQSTAPVHAEDGWHTYTRDHIRLLDHLNIDRCHVMGGCIGGPYCFGVMQAAPDRVNAAILQQTIGYDDNRQAFYDMFDGWADALRDKFSNVSDDSWRQFRSSMYDGDFLFNVDRDFIRHCTTPMLVLMGSDLYHPESVSREVAELAPNARLVERWKNPESDNTLQIVLDFLRENTP
jgi:pimeloyl-ACP methyl ester carboxylesterase